MTSRHLRAYDSVLDVIGWTPLIRLRRVVGRTRTPVFGKAEFMNPGGSVKDRIGPAIIEAAEREGRLKPGGTIVEGTSGNTGIALAIAAADKGYRCVFTISDKFSQEKVRLLKAFGAEVIVTPAAVPPDHPDNYLQTAKRIAHETPNAILADQFYNQANPEAHYRTTGPEIWEQTEGRVTHFVAAAGTGGTISGAGRYLKERNPSIRVVAGDPVGSILRDYATSGVQIEPAPYKVEGIGQDKIPGTLDFAVVDEWRTVDDRTSFNVARRLTREEGLFVGGSSGLIVSVGLDIAREIDDPDACVVCVLCDTGERYLSRVYNEEWLRENRLIDPSRITVDLLIASKEGEAPDLIAVEPSTPVRRALAFITDHNVSQLPVIAEGDCVGHVSEGTLMARVLGNPTVLDSPVQELMDPPLPVVDSHVDLPTVTRLLSRRNPAVLVRRDGRIVGIITRFDLLRHVTS